jgi:hypothetical protein
MKISKLLTIVALAAISVSALSACTGIGGGPKGDSNASTIMLKFDGIERQNGGYLFKRKSADGSVAEYVQTDSPLELDLSKSMNFADQKKAMNLPGSIDQECEALLNSGFVLVEKTDFVEKKSAGRLFFAKPAITADAQAKEGEEAKRFQTVEVLYGLHVQPQQ